MFLIMEGVDGGGKSTLVEKLISLLDDRGLTVDSLHRGVPERPVLDEYQLDVEDYRPGQGRAILADRWHWGDLVYGELYRGESYLGEAGFRFVELFLRSRGAVTILIENDVSEIRRRLVERGEDYLQLDHIGRVIEHYQRVFRDSVTGAIVTREPDPEAVIKHGEFWANSTADLAPFPTYIGGRSPRVLLVGDKRGDPSTPSLTAFRPTTRGNSAQFLLEALPAKLWKEVGLCNANEETDLPALVEVLAQPPVIALGHEASKALRSCGIEHAAVPHPQKVRRFHHAQKIQYGWLIESVIGKTDKRFSWPR